ncbi:helix-turn-helix transcriptional regulator [Saccharopolyspora sp. NPDC050389]|uniref:helix-turn-helix domain-containing protein n=1 Tax=Saccharopolyspora sp. NPDC050389 TaxID=3155516 RepID=UPI003408800B
MADSPRARALAAELRAARKARKLSQGQIADQIGWSVAKVSRVETAKTGITEADVSALLAVLRVKGKDREHLLKMARELDQPAWWELHSGLPSQLRALIDAEQRAARITNVAPTLIPGLLQTRGYTRAVYEAAQLETADVDAGIGIRQTRQGVLEKSDPVDLIAFVDESVLSRPVGGHAVAGEQLRYLIKLSDRPHITIRVLPLGLGVHTGLDGNFSVFELPRAQVTVHIEARHAGVFLSEPGDVAPFKKTLDRLAQVALNAKDSTQLVARYAAEHEEASYG